MRKNFSWLIGYVLSPLFLQFGFDSKDFWFGKSNPWDKNEYVRFRYFKMYISTYIGLSLKMCLLIPYGIYKDVTSEDGFCFTCIVFFLFAPAISLILSIEDWYVYWKQSRTS